MSDQVCRKCGGDGDLYSGGEPEYGDSDSMMGGTPTNGSETCPRCHGSGDEPEGFFSRLFG
jgi:hypothetical protein